VVFPAPGAAWSTALVCAPNAAASCGSTASMGRVTAGGEARTLKLSALK
jgi:hypothetical protein